jgi:acylphosphatase
VTGSRKTRHLHITGRVQGVGYRQWFAHTAQAQGVMGWVRNRRDGSVESTISGPQGAVEVLIEQARKGPHLSRVDHIQCNDVEDEGWPDFRIRPTE